jgi:phage FluMu protein Com
MTIATRKRAKRDKVPVSISELGGTAVSELRCSNKDCGKFLCYENIQVGIVQHKCHRCKTWTELSRLPEKTKKEVNNIREVHCQSCGRFLFQEAMVSGVVKSKCRGCGTWNVLDI